MSHHHNRPCKHFMYSKSSIYDDTYTLRIKNFTKVNDNGLTVRDCIVK